MSQLGPNIRTLAPPSETEQFPATQVAAEFPTSSTLRNAAVTNPKSRCSVRFWTQKIELMGQILQSRNISGNWFFLRVPQYRWKWIRKIHVFARNTTASKLRRRSVHPYGGAHEHCLVPGAMQVAEPLWENVLEV